MPAFTIIGFNFPCEILTDGSAARLHDFMWVAQDNDRQESCTDTSLTCRHVETENTVFCKFTDFFVLWPYLALTPSRVITLLHIMLQKGQNIGQEDKLSRAPSSKG